MAKRPLIGVTGPNRGGEAAWIFTAWAVFWHGGRPIRITPDRPADAAVLDGLIIGGGADLDPNTYEKRDFIKAYFKATLQKKNFTRWQRFKRLLRFWGYPLIYIVRRFWSRKSFMQDPARDALEFRLLNEAYHKRIPILGICRGAQLINVYFGGNLHQEIREFYTEGVTKASVLPVKKVFLESESKIAGITRTKFLMVNAIHHQAVNNAGLGIRIVGKEKNGIVQAIEHESYPFLIGVQWHPEYLTGRKTQQRLFRAFVRAAG